MKYIKLYEAFTSNILSKIYKHLKKKNTSDKSLSLFKSELNTITKLLDIPMDKISDEDVKYISRKKALLLKPDSEVKNESGICAIKFWFDKDGEFIGSSGTGNVFFSDSNPKFGVKNLPYNKDQWVKMTKLVRYRFPKNGILKPVEDYSELKSGDQVIGVLCASEEYTNSKVDRLINGRIFVDNNGSVYFIHQNSDMEGSGPEIDPNEEYPDIDWGYYSWQLTNSRKNPLPDHFNLHLVLPSDKPLHYLVNKNVTGDNPFEYNVSLEETEDKLILSSWIGNEEERNNIDKNGDFAIILFIDDILSRGLKSRSVISDEKKSARIGATALMTDGEFRQMNLDKYLRKLVDRFGISDKSIDLKNLEKIVSNITYGGNGVSYSFFSLLGGEYRDITTFSNLIKRLVSTDMTDPKKINVTYYGFLHEYEEMKKRVSKSYKMKKICMDMLKTHDELKPLYEPIMRISNKITDGILSKKITRGEDLKKLLFKVSSVASMLMDTDFVLTDELINLSEYFRDENRIKYRIDDLLYRYKNSSENLIERDLKTLSEVESYVDDLFN